MQIEVYERDVDAVDAAASEAAAGIVAAGDAPAVAVPGGRQSRAVLVALAAHGEVAWASTRWFVTDETCGDAAAPDSARQLVMSTVLAPNHAPASTLSVPDRALDATQAGRAWETDVRRVAEAPEGFAVIVVTVGRDGSIAGLAPGGPADGLVVVTEGGRVSLGAGALAAARRIVVVATGAAVGPAVQDALTAALDPTMRPLQRVLPDDGRITWYVDRAAVAGLLADARVVEA